MCMNLSSSGGGKVIPGERPQWILLLLTYNTSYHHDVLLQAHGVKGTQEQKGYPRVIKHGLL